MENSNSPKKKLGFGAIVMSTLAAALGVQNRKNHERDFSQGSITTYIIAGIIFTIGFIASVYLVVSIVLSQSH